LFLISDLFVLFDQYVINWHSRKPFTLAQDKLHEFYIYY